MPANYHRTYGLTTVTDATVTITDDGYLGAPIVLNRAAGVTATLPPATGSGNRYEFILLVDATGNQIVQVANASDTMMGMAYIGADGETFYTADASDTITLNGTTTGGEKGARIICDDVAANVWAVVVMSEASGTEATPFSAAVS